MPKIAMPMHESQFLASSCKKTIVACGQLHMPHTASLIEFVAINNVTHGPKETNTLSCSSECGSQHDFGLFSIVGVPNKAKNTEVSFRGDSLSYTAANTNHSNRIDRTFHPFCWAVACCSHTIFLATTMN